MKPSIRLASLAALCLALVAISVSLIFGCGPLPSGSSFSFPTTFGTWESMANIPERVGGGGAIVWTGGNYLYATVGSSETLGSSEGFYRYNISNNTWEPMASSPADTYYGAALVYVNGNIYASRGGMTKDFWKYNIGLDSWEVMPKEFPLETFNGTLAVVNNKIYALFGVNPYNVLYQYNFATNTFESLANTPGGYPDNFGCSIVWTGGDTVYFRNGNNNTYFWKYSISGDTHATTIANYRDAIGRMGNSGLAYPGGDHIYSIRGKLTVSFEAYDIVNDSWESRANVPYQIWDGGCLVWAGANHMYVLRGYDEMNFWRFTPQ